MPKMVHFKTSFWKHEVCGQTVLPDRSVLIGQKLVETAKIKCDILSNFQTMWAGFKEYENRLQTWVTVNYVIDSIISQVIYI
mgnify:CR=1 FL=1